MSITTDETTSTIDNGRRALIKAAAAAGAVGILPGLQAAAYAAGSDKPEQQEVKIGFISLTDCASVVMASVLGFDKKYGVKIIPTKEASWAGVRDKVVNGELDMAHVLYGLVYGVHLGVAGPKKDMAVLMTINNNGQGLSLSRKLADKGARNLESLAGLMKKEPREYVYKAYVNTSVNAINERILGRYQDGLGKTWDDPNHMKFFNDGAVTFPYLSDGMWFLTQHKRWGLLKQHPDYLAVARQINRIELYKEAAAALKVDVPRASMRTSRLMDGVVWEGKDPAKYADAFKVRA